MLRLEAIVERSDDAAVVGAFGHRAGRRGPEVLLAENLIQLRDQSFCLFAVLCAKTTPNSSSGLALRVEPDRVAKDDCPRGSAWGPAERRLELFCHRGPPLVVVIGVPWVFRRVYQRLCPVKSIRNTYGTTITKPACSLTEGQGTAGSTPSIAQRACASARSTNRQRALISRICSMVQARDSSSRGLATTKARHIARQAATFRRLRENRNSRVRGTSSALDVAIE